jgi:hypothetical protein
LLSFVVSKFINVDNEMTHSSEKDFDFLFGQWRVFHRRLKIRLADNHDWQEFEGKTTAQPLLGGLGNVDDNVLHLPDGTYRAVSMRSFDPVLRRWAIWWLDARNPHQLDTPVIGTFENNVGTFFANDHFNGQPILVRFRWTQTQSASPLWEQAFSADNGVTWEDNWTMRFERVTTTN